MATWGVVGDYADEFLYSPPRMEYFFGREIKDLMPGDPEFAIELVDQLAPCDESMCSLSVRWFAKLGYRLARIATYADNYAAAADSETKKKLLPSLFWARRDVSKMLADLVVSIRGISFDKAPPTTSISTVSGNSNIEGVKDAAIAIVEWVANVLLDDLRTSHQRAYRSFLLSSFGEGIFLDEYIVACAEEMEALQVHDGLVRFSRDSLDAAVDRAAELGLLDKIRQVIEEVFELDLPLDTTGGDVDSVAALKSAFVSVSDEKLLSEFVDGVPEIVDVAIWDLLLKKPRIGLSSIGWKALRAQVETLQRQGLNVGITLRVDDSYGVFLVDEIPELGYLDCGAGEIIVHDASSGVEIHAVRTWTELLENGF
jgi:hypothetical protein